MPAAPIQNVSRERATCPTCGAPAQRGQLVCLECGSRVSLAYRRPPSWKVPAAITALVLLMAAIGAVVAFRAIDKDAKGEVSATPAKPKRGAADASDRVATPTGGERGQPAGADQEEPKGGESEEEDPPAEPEPDLGESAETGDEAATSSGGIVKQGDLYSWPRSLRGFTVVLLSNEDRASATRFARSATDSGEEIGVISSGDFRTLPQGFFVVFAGRYASRAEADKAAARLGSRFRGAFPQLVRR